MPRIPLVQQQTRAQGGFRRTGADARSFGLADELQGSVSGFLGAQQKEQDIEDKNAIAQTYQQLAQADTDITQIALDLQNTAPLDEYTEQLSSGVNDYFDKTGESITNLRAQEAWARETTQMKSSYMKRGLLFEAVEKGKRAKRGEEQAHANRMNTVFVDPTQYGEAVRRSAMGTAALNMPEGKQEEWLQMQVFDLGANAARGMITNAQDVESAQEVVTQLEGQGWQDRIDGTRYPGLVQAARKRVTDIQAANDRAVKASHASNLVQMNWEHADLTRGLKDGSKGEADIEQFRIKWQDQNQAAAKYLAQQTVFDKEREKLANIFRVTQVQQGVGVLNPHESKDRKAVEQTFKAALDDMRNASPDQLKAFSMQFVESTGVMPDTLKNTIVGGLNSPNSEKRVEAAYMMEGVFNSSPQTRDQFSSAHVGWGTELVTYMDSGATPQEAVDLQEKNRGVNDSVRQGRKATFGTTFGDDEAVSFINDKMDDGWYGDWATNPDIPPELVREIKKSAEAEFTSHGSIEAAGEAAFKRAQRVWGTTEFGGSKRMMKFAPSLMYGIPTLSESENESWIQTQLIKDVALGTVGNEELSADTLNLVASPRVTRLDGKPSYVVLLKTKEGTFTDLGLWAPDFNKSDKFNEMQADAAKKLEDAAGIRADALNPEAKLFGE